MTEALLLSLAVSLGLTLALELAFALLWGIRKDNLLLVVLMNLLTNPAAVTLQFLLTNLAGLGFWICAVPIEIAVVLTEGLCIRGRIRRPWRFALLLNLFSFGLGLLIQLI